MSGTVSKREFLSDFCKSFGSKDPYAIKCPYCEGGTMWLAETQKPDEFDDDDNTLVVDTKLLCRICGGGVHIVTRYVVDSYNFIFDQHVDTDESEEQ